jgi:glucosylceramidase
MQQFSNAPGCATFFRHSVGRSLSLCCVAMAIVGCADTNAKIEKMPPDDASRSLRVILTARDTGDRLEETRRIPLVAGQPTGLVRVRITVDPDKTFQEIVGFGGAFTEAAAFTLSRISPDKRAEAIQAYFHPQKGIGYTLCRTHINSCDFSLENYSYDDVDGDFDLRHFDISRDRRWLMPLIKDAMLVPGACFRILASPWSPPAWMKTNGQMNHGGRLKPQCRRAWAMYFAKYIEAYAADGVPIWGVTVQNEPAAVQTWDSCIYSAEEERDFVRDHLGPTLEKRGLGDVKILVWDHNKDIIYERVEPILADPEAAKYVWGVGFHWYTGDHFDNLKKTHDAFPDKKLLFTEGCQEGGVHLGSWEVAERYGHDIIGDLNNWAVGWIDWNMVLDERGGPNHVDNLCDAPIIADTVRNRLYYQPSYYYLGHFSRYVHPQAVRVGCSTTVEDLEATAFLNADGKAVVIIMNRTDRAVEFDFVLKQMQASLSSPPHSIMSLILE